MAKAKLAEHSFQNTDLERKNPKSTDAPVLSPKDAFEDFVKIPLELIVSESNIRTTYDEESIIELSRSLEEYGQLQPIRVYEKNGEYVIIFGHRRFLAAKMAGLIDMKCILTQKPDSLDKVYIQAIENEHAKQISSEDREKYVHLLRYELHQDEKTIARRMGKTPAWVSQTLAAYESRQKNQDIFNEKGIEITTTDAYSIRNAEKDDVENIAEQIKETPRKKTQIIKEIREKTSKSQRSKSDPKSQRIELAEFSSEAQENNSDADQNDNNNNISAIEAALSDIEIITNDNFDASGAEIVPQPFPVPSHTKEMELKVIITKNDTDNSVSLKPSCLGITYDQNIIPIIIEKLTEYYHHEGYLVKTL
jgi:ParB family chromosome partitioning protein